MLLLLLGMILRRENHLAVRIGLVHFLELDAFRALGTRNNTLLLHLQLENLLRLELLVHLYLLLHHHVSLRVDLSSLHLSVPVHHLLVQSLLLARSLDLRELGELLLLCSVVRLHPLLLDILLLLALVLQFKILLKLEELAPYLFLAVLRNLLDHTQSVFGLLGLGDLLSTSAAVSCSRRPRLSRINRLILAAPVTHTNSLHHGVTRRPALSVHRAIAIVHVQHVVVRVLAELESSLLRETRTLRQERIRVKLLLQL